MIGSEHLAVAQLFFVLPESSFYGVGGGLAAVAHGIIDRRTEDIDLFRDRRRPGVRPIVAAEALAAAALARGWGVDWTHRFPDHARLGIVMSGTYLLVDIGLDAFDLPLETTALGPTLAERDVAVGKVVALFDRAEARDFVDVFAFAQRHDREELLHLALLRDPGLRREHLSERMRRMTEVLDPLQLPEGHRERFEEIRDFFEDWRDALSG